MLSNTTEINSAKLNATESALSKLIEETAGLASSFELLENICNDGKCLLDSQVMRECRDMIGTMNRLLCEQSGRLAHLNVMQGVHKAAMSEYERLNGKSRNLSKCPTTVNS
ncbi:MAG: hypothetical protein IAB91_07925 [Bacteroidetes bacterium]|uniref:Uncharacterized protein n=1 Tax=Candidatus Cryptobacteroides faecigallinarum TaxID=2840763 RepID=A0A9D9IMV5_9BACT|nr:hypothetical protein [Candidatus Cryptobacteroides faecigallinarum]